MSWWSSLPLAVAVALLSCRLQLSEGDPDWRREGCPARPSVLFLWLFSRFFFVAFPMCLLSFQVALYLPSSDMLPRGPEVDFFMCGGCVLVSAKFCAMCGSFARQRVAQAFVLLVLLSADWIGSMHMMAIIGDDAKQTLLLGHLLLAGIVQCRIALERFCLLRRWARVLSRRSIDARDGVGLPGVDVELGAHINADRGSASVISANAVESSDSDDERGPGSLPDGFYEALLSILGVPSPRESARRQFLCGVRSAVVPHAAGEQTSRVEGGTSLATVAPEGPSATAVTPTPEPSSSSAAPAGVPEASTPGPPLDIPPDEGICTVCQEDIRTGDAVRPLPKCSHVFHAACLERWARTMRESTRCPTCRRPALSRRAAEGAVSIRDLQTSGQGEDPSPASPSRGNARSSTGRGASRGNLRSPFAAPRSDAGGASPRASPPRPGGPRPKRSGRPQNYVRSGTATSLRTSLGISEALAHAALQCAGGAPDVAANIVLEHRSLIQATFGATASTAAAAPPPGVVEAFIEANPDLAGAETPLRQQLGRLYQSSQLPFTPWVELASEGRAEVFRVVLEDVVHRLEDDQTA
eukprot:CAMPEP_0117490118 /NCGR_PEP_ID=MMETSP0784-20121206/17386_1 /TAXON_ID=39447 /ORGANISM="" /LENGTH=581 /DNA_ID=CAMNT_0005284867 /DNA_START=319 /DNA_END=2064 /DNA_ORIENTATION=+